VFTWKYTCIHTYVFIYIHIIWIYIYAFIYVNTPTHPRTHTLTHTWMCMRVYIQTCLYVHLHTSIQHTQIQTHTHTPTWWLSPPLLSVSSLRKIFCTLLHTSPIEFAVINVFSNGSNELVSVCPGKYSRNSQLCTDVLWQTE